MAVLIHFPRSAPSVVTAGLLALLVSGCSMSALKPAPGPATAALEAFATPEATPDGHVPDAELIPEAPMALAYAEGSGAGAYAGLVAHYAEQYDVPETLIHRVIMRESKYNAAARNGPYYGLMQISHATAKGMGYTGAPAGLLDAETNLRYAVRYLAGAYVTANRDADAAMRFYARGFYYDAKRAGLLEEAGLR